MENNQLKYVVHVVPRTWFGRVITMVGAVVVGVLAILFLTIFAICVIVLATIFLASAVLMARISGQGARNNIVDVEYSVDTMKKPTLNVSHMELADDRDAIRKLGRR